MTPEFAIHAVSAALMAAFWVAAPLLVIAFAVGVLVNLVQIATSLQDPVFSTVPRLAACLAGFLLLLPWMLHRASDYTAGVLRDFAQYAR